MNDHFCYVATFNKKYFNCFACSSSSEKLHSEKLGRENYRNTARIFTPELLSKLPAKSFLFHKDINCEMD